MALSKASKTQAQLHNAIFPSPWYVILSYLSNSLDVIDVFPLSLMSLHDLALSLTDYDQHLMDTCNPVLLNSAMDISNNNLTFSDRAWSARADF